MVKSWEVMLATIYCIVKNNKNNIQASSDFKYQFSTNPFMRDLYQAMVTKFLCEMTGWSIAV